MSVATPKIMRLNACLSQVIGEALNWALGLAATQLTKKKKKKASHAELHLDGSLEEALATDCPVRRAPPTVEWKALIRIQEIHTILQQSRSYKDTAQSDSKCAGRRVLLWICRFRGMNRIPIISYAFLLPTPLVTCLSLPQPIQLCWHSTLAKIWEFARKTLITSKWINPYPHLHSSKHPHGPQRCV